jgi:hypothetical protein
MTPETFGTRIRKLAARVLGSMWVIPILSIAALAFVLLALLTEGRCVGLEPCVHKAFSAIGIGRPGLDGLTSQYGKVGRTLFVLAALFALAKAWTVAFREQWESFRLRFLRNHAVVCGVGEKGRLLASALRARGLRVVLIDSQSANPALAQCRAERMLVRTGDATDAALLKLVRVQRARYLVITCHDDDTQARILNQARTLVAGRAEPLRTLMHVDDLDLFTLVRSYEIARTPAGLQLQCFNVYERGARTLLTAHPFDRGPDGAAHVLVIGLGRFGSSVLLHAVRRWRHAHPESALTVTVVDRDADERVRALCARYPALASACRIVPVVMHTRSAAFERGDYLRGVRPTAIYICLADTVVGLTAALHLRNRLPDSDLPIVARVASESGLGRLIATDVATFPLVPRTCRLDLIEQGTTEIIAQAVHLDYVTHRIRDGETRETNPSMRPWDELSEEQRGFNRTLALDIGNKLHAVGYRVAPLTDWQAPLPTFTEDQIERLAELEHERWMTEHLRDEWRLGPKDPEGKTHSALVPWAMLPREEREKDRQIVGSIPSILALVGFRVIRCDTADTVCGVDSPGSTPLEGAQ